MCFIDSTLIYLDTIMMYRVLFITLRYLCIYFSKQTIGWLFRNVISNNDNKRIYILKWLKETASELVTEKCVTEGE